MRRTPAWAAATTALSVTLLTGCGSAGPAPTANPTSAPTPSASSVDPGPYNGTDVAFALALRQFDDQARDLAALVSTRSAHPDLATLSATVTPSRDDLAVVHDWAARWRDQNPTPSPRASGMLTPAELRALSAMHGEAFDDAWLEHTARTYDALIALSRQEVSHGVNPEARDLAARQVSVRTTQLNQVRQFHDTWMHDKRLGPSTATTVPSTSPRPRHIPAPQRSDAPRRSESPRHNPAPQRSDAPRPSESPHYRESPHMTGNPYPNDHGGGSPHR